MQNGIVLAAFGQLAYLVQSVLALGSVRQHSELPVTLVTDQSEHPLLVGAGFDNIVQLDSKATAAMPHDFALPLLARVEALRLSPYDITLNLDVDARLRKPELPRLFDVCAKADIAVAPCLLDTSRERAMYDRPLWNNGVILYRQSAAVMKMFESFEVLFSEHLRVATTPDAKADCLNHIPGVDTRKRLLCSDQIALAQIFSPVVNTFNLKYAHLPEHWNWRGGNSNRVCAEDVIIDHHPNIRNETFNQLADCAFDLLSSGEAAKSALYYDCALTALDPGLLQLSPAQHFERLADFADLQSVLGRLRGVKIDAQSASLLAVALFHQRTQPRSGKALSILNGLAKTLK